MTDLRLLANDLIGKRVNPRRDNRDQWPSRNPDNYKYIIEEVHSSYVLCNVTCENGYKFKESITLGELIQLGMVECEGQITDEPQEGYRWKGEN